MPSIKITQLSDIGANLSPTTLFPVVDMSLVPTTDKANLQIIGNLILRGAGGANFASINISNHSSNTQIMFNDANVLSGNANLTFNKSTGILSIPTVSTSNIKSGGNTWTFHTDGRLQWPTTNGNWFIGTDDESNSFELYSNSGIVISTNVGNTYQEFLFGMDGVFTAPANVNITGERLSVGNGASNINLQAPTLVTATDHPTYVQASIFNFASTGSADFITYGAQGNDDEGWNDMGFTGQTFNDPNYNITSPGDGYLFCQTYSGNNFSGNFVIATGENALNGDIIFATGGFTTGQDKARITGSGKMLVGYHSSQDSSLLQVNGNITANAIKVPGIYSTGTVDINVGGNTSGGWNFGTDGVLTWPSPVGDWKIGNSNNEFEISSTTSVVIQTDISNVGSHFMFDQSGIFHAPGNVVIHGQVLTVGQGSESIPLNGPVIVAGTNNPYYVQTCVYNFNPNGSADVTTNGADGTDTEGWTDMGFTGYTFNDPNYTITGPGDGYIFVQTYANGNPGGNLVLATGTNSNVGDIIFATGGFLTGQDKARITGSGKLLIGYSTSQDNALVQVNGQVSAGVVKTGVYNSGNIPTASSAGAGARAFVTDSSSSTFAAAYTGGGSTKVPVYSDGTNWYIG